MNRNIVIASASVRYLCEQHIKEDCGGKIPTVADWFRNIQRGPRMACGYLLREQAVSRLTDDKAVSSNRVSQEEA